MRIACYITCPITFWQTKEALEGAGFECKQFHSLNDLCISLRSDPVDLILVDVEDSDQPSLYAWIGCRTDQTAPLVLLFGPSFGTSDIVKALNAGADDVIRRPVAQLELLARVRAVLLRTHKTHQARRLEMLGYSLNRGTCVVTDNGTHVPLTPREFALAWLFFSAPDTFLSRKTIAATIWGVDVSIANRTLEQHVSMLRRKLKLCSGRGISLRATYNKGYRLEVSGGNEVVKSDGRSKRHIRNVRVVAEAL